MNKQEKNTNLELSSNPELGFNAMLVGSPGSGKTSSICTLAKTGLEVFVLFVEQGVNNLKKSFKLHNLTPEEVGRIHYAYISPARGSFSKLSKGATAVNRAPEFGKMASGNRRDHSQFIDLLNACANFVDQNGEEFGAVDDWDSSRVLIIDGLSGLNDMCMSLVVGDKPVKTLQDWGVAIDQLDKFIKQCCNTECSFVLLAHLEQEKDEVSGRMIITASALGRKLGALIGRHFQDVMLSSKTTGKYIWSTEDSRIELKASNLKDSSSLPPTFVPLINAWRSES